MKKISALFVALMLLAVPAFAFQNVPDASEREFSAKEVKELVVSDFDVSVTIIADSGKTIRIKSEVPISGMTMAYHNGKLIIVGNKKPKRENGIPIGSGATVSTFNGRNGYSYIRQETHGDNSPVISGGGNVSISYGGAVVTDDEGIIIRVPKRIKIQTKGIIGNLQIIQ